MLTLFRINPSRSFGQLMSRGLLGTALIWIGLAACSPAIPDAQKSNRFVVEPVTITHEVHFPPGETRLSAGEKTRLSRFLATLDQDQAGALFLDGTGALASDRHDAVERYIQATGRRPVARNQRQASLRSDVVLLSLRRNVILPSACLDADGWPVPDLLPANCANELNLLEMVENQRDLLQGRHLGPAPAAPAGDLARQYINRFSGTPAEAGLAKQAPPPRPVR